MAVYQIIKAVFIKSWKIQMHYKGDTLSMIFRPLLTILPYVLFADYFISAEADFAAHTGTGNYKLYIVASLIFTNFIVNSISYTVGTIVDELQQGTIENLLILPVRFKPYWCIELFFSMLMQLAAAVLLLITSCLLLGLKFANIHFDALIFVILISILLNMGIGILLSAVTMKTKMAKMAYLILSILIFIAGEMYPVEVFPVGLRILAYLNPITYLLDIVRYSMIGTTTYMNIVMEMILTLALTVIVFGWSMHRYNKIIKTLKQTGNLTQY